MARSKDTKDSPRPMTNDQIKEIALANGFKLKEQPDGGMDLNPYVYEFARAIYRQNACYTYNNFI